MTAVWVLAGFLLLCLAGTVLWFVLYFWNGKGRD